MWNLFAQGGVKESRTDAVFQQHLGLSHEMDHNGGNGRELHWRRKS
jgi:hypothetical protein